MTRFATLAAAAVLALGACTSSGGATTGPTSAPSTAASAAPSSAAPSVAPSSTAPSASATQAPSAAPSVAAECMAASLKTLNAGVLTVGTDNPAFPPWFGGDPAAGSTWQVSDPTSQKGLESATAYAIAQTLGYAPDMVKWVAVPFNNAIQPGPKAFDILLNQVGATPERAEAVDLSDGYFDDSQSLVTDADRIKDVKTLADIKGYQLGVQVGTTSLAYITTNIQPTKAPRVYTTNDLAVAALKAKQVDGIVVDLGTAFYVTAAQLDNGRIVGSLPDIQAPEHFSVVLQKGSALTPCINQAIGVLKANGTLDTIRKINIESQGQVPAITQ